MNKYSKEGFLRESIFIYKIPDAVGHYPLSRSTDPWAVDELTGATFYLSTDDGDVSLGPSYKLLEPGHDNFLEIDKKKGDEIWGKFRITFVRDSPPDTVYFTNGDFHTKILH